MAPETTTHSLTVEHVMSNIEQGRVRLPRSRRDFVWTVEASAALLDRVPERWPGRHPDPAAHPPAVEEG